MARSHHFILQIIDSNLLEYICAAAIEYDDPLIRLSIAQNIFTNAETLSQLAQDEQTYVRCAVSCNLNTSEDDLRYLSQEFALEVLSNTACTEALRTSIYASNYLASSMYPLTSGEVLGGIYRKVAEKYSALSEIELSDYEVILQITKNQNTPLSILVSISELILNEIEDEVPKEANRLLIAIFGHDSYSKADLQRSYSLLIALAFHPLFPAELVLNIGAKLSNLMRAIPDSVNQTERYNAMLIAAGIAGKSELSSEIIDRLLETKNFRVLLALASNPTIPIEKLSQLAAINLDGNLTLVIRWLLISNVGASTEFLDEIASDIQLNSQSAQFTHNGKEFTLKGEQLRVEAAMKLGSSSVLLSSMLIEDSTYLKFEICRNLTNHFPRNLFEILSRDQDYRIRKTIGENPSCPSAILTNLAKDSKYPVRRSVAKNPAIELQLIEQLARDNSMWVREGVARNPNCPIHLLEILAKDEHSRVRYAVALNRASHQEILFDLGTESEEDENSSFVRLGVARNLNAPYWILLNMLDDSYKYVRNEAAKALEGDLSLMDIHYREITVKRPFLIAHWDSKEINQTSLTLKIYEVDI